MPHPDFKECFRGLLLCLFPGSGLRSVRQQTQGVSSLHSSQVWTQARTYWVPELWVLSKPRFGTDCLEQPPDWSSHQSDLSAVCPALCPSAWHRLQRRGWSGEPWGIRLWAKQAAVYLGSQMKGGGQVTPNLRSWSGLFWLHDPLAMKAPRLFRERTLRGALLLFCSASPCLKSQYVWIPENLRGPLVLPPPPTHPHSFYSDAFICYYLGNPLNEFVGLGCQLKIYHLKAGNYPNVHQQSNGCINCGIVTH